MKLKDNVCDFFRSSVWFQEALVGSVRRISNTLMGRRSLWTPASSQCRTTLHMFPLKSLTSPLLMRSDTTLALRWVYQASAGSCPAPQTSQLNHLWTNEILFCNDHRINQASVLPSYYVRVFNLSDRSGQTIFVTWPSIASVIVHFC